MPEESDLKEAIADAFPPWFWGVGVVLVLGITVALVVWYVEHPDRSPWTDFQRLSVPNDLSGLVSTPSEDGPPSAEG